MILKKIHIEGFRNFKDAEINLNKQSLIIGSNDVGKTNLLYAIRILLDRSFSDYDLELKDSDFYAYEETNSAEITLYIEDVVEECIVAKLPGRISDDNQLVIRYVAQKNLHSSTYSFYIGKSDSEADMKLIESPYYRRFLNVKYISSKRDFWGYINKVKYYLLQKTKDERDASTIEDDEALYQKIANELKSVDDEIPNLSYVKNATDCLNAELDKLSIHNRSQKIVFDVASTDVDKLISNVNLSSKYDDKKMIVGGEGRINQIYLSLWASQNQPTSTSTEVSIICIEEPEAYLHPHQQRELASYLSKQLSGQVILTSHSPYIASEFSPNSIVRLFRQDGKMTKIASDGCSEIIESGFKDLGYRMSVVPAETFFSDYVILVEGQSEMVFYKTLAKQLNINLDRLNISVLCVEGVDFKVYINILNALSIPWCLRTDNDITQIPNKSTYRYAGIERGLDIITQTNSQLLPSDYKVIEDNKYNLRGFDDINNIPIGSIQSAKILTTLLCKYNILIANVDLETDLVNSNINKTLKDYYGNDLSDEAMVKKMKGRKASNMFEFLREKKESLAALADDDITKPLILAKTHIEGQYGTY